MKFYKYFAVMLTLVLLLSANAFAQEERDMSTDEWEAEMARLGESKTNLTGQLDALNKEVADLKTKRAGMQTYEACMEELNALVGASDADIAAFGNKVNALQAKVNAKQSPKERSLPEHRSVD